MAESLSSLVCAFRVPCGFNALTASYTSCLTISKTKTGALLKLGLEFEKCGKEMLLSNTIISQVKLLHFLIKVKPIYLFQH